MWNKLEPNPTFGLRWAGLVLTVINLHCLAFPTDIDAYIGLTSIGQDWLALALVVIAWHFSTLVGV
eukprot:9540078-Lingulodinium_polyedra.AAC.1